VLLLITYNHHRALQLLVNSSGRTLGRARRTRGYVPRRCGCAGRTRERNGSAGSSAIGGHRTIPPLRNDRTEHRRARTRLVNIPDRRPTDGYQVGTGMYYSSTDEYYSSIGHVLLVHRRVLLVHRARTTRPSDTYYSSIGHVLLVHGRVLLVHRTRTTHPRTRTTRRSDTYYSSTNEYYSSIGHVPLVHKTPRSRN